MRLNNPFGVNTIKHGEAAGNLHYQSLQRATSDWESMFGDRIFGDTVPSYFAYDLQHPLVGKPYNTANPNWETDFVKLYDDVLTFMETCNIKW